MKNEHLIMTPVLLGLLALAIFNGGTGCSGGVSEDINFERTATRYLDQMLSLNPEWATNLGDHRFDDKVSDLSAEGFKKRAAFNQAYLDTLLKIDAEKLSLQNKIDWEILVNQTESVIFSITEVKEHQWNPTFYNVGDGLYNILARDYAPLKDRLLALRGRLVSIPLTIAAAKENLSNPPEIMTLTAMRQNPGIINLVMDDLQDYLDEVPELREEFRPLRAEAITALTEYGRWLENDLLPRSHGDFRLGENLFRKKLAYVLASDLSPEVILESALMDLAATQETMYQLALPLYEGNAKKADKGAVIREVLDRLADNHPTNETIVAQANADLLQLTDFVREHDLVTVPSNPVELIVMPEHQRGFSIAYCDSPGPLETNGTTFYAISPTPKHWDQKKALSFYREYNDHMLRDLTIHEAMPGHYLQIAHANKFKASTPLRAVFSSGTFVEGWATYAEQFMAEAGYGGPEVHLQQLKMRLRLIINAIIDQKIHMGGMTRVQAMEMMMVEGFQEEGEADGKWVRAQLSSTQLSTYYVGNMELNNLRQDYEAAEGESFNLKQYHDRLLSYGSPAPKYLHQLLGL
jgi:uncharacterized protein (DUF885 family)